MKKNGIIKDKFTMCYSYGSYNKDTLEILKTNNYTMGSTTKAKSVELKNTCHMICRGMILTIFHKYKG